MKKAMIAGILVFVILGMLLTSCSTQQSGNQVNINAETNEQPSQNANEQPANVDAEVNTTVDELDDVLVDPNEEIEIGEII
ncbi:MAG: hypothetical protein PWP03_331 [Candidatus Woesearchaeota archaeon]|nr:hypothetical protein [Candidatus Woesearchaeota archaeon]MDN5327693.1 hypothetical protein [Candidatus Woesearchaeota archaeon]